MYMRGGLFLVIRTVCLRSPITRKPTGTFSLPLDSLVFVRNQDIDLAVH